MTGWNYTVVLIKSVTLQCVQKKRDKSIFRNVLNLGDFHEIWYVVS